MSSVVLMSIAGGLMGYIWYEYRDEICFAYKICHKKAGSHRKAVVVFLYYVCFMLWTLLEQTFHHRVRRISKSRIEVDYVYHGVVYTLQLSVPYGPFFEEKVLQIIDQENNDVTERMHRYLGPLKDFHCLQYTPKDFNFKELTINWNNGESTTYEATVPLDKF